MNQNLKARLWGGLGTALIFFFLPVGIYAFMQSSKLFRSLKLDDNLTVEECMKKIKNCWLITLAFYAFIIILGISGALD